MDKSPTGTGWSLNVGGGRGRWGRWGGGVPDFTTILGPLFWDSLPLGLYPTTSSSSIRAVGGATSS